jgi:DNA-binding CsgD family transcriptional regulator
LFSSCAVLTSLGTVSAPRGPEAVLVTAVAEKRVVSPNLVGRSDELDLLVRALSDPPAVVVVDGEAGIGKTRLVAELSSRPELGGRRMIGGGCRHVREPFPLGPLIDALRGVGDDLAGADLSPLTGTLRPLIPELANTLPVAPEPLEERLAERHRVFRALVEILGSLGAAVLVLEDLHWADEQTIDFIGYLLGDMPAKLAVVLTFRSEEAQPRVRALAARVPDSIDRAHLALRPLDANKTGALAAAILGTDRVSSEFAGYLHERTSGLPFAIEELLALLRSRGTLVPRGGGWARRELDALDVPTGIRDSVLERVSRLSDDARGIAEAAAVLQTPMRVSVLVGTSALLAPAVRGGLTAALESGVLTEHGEAVGFRHLLAAQAVYDDIPISRRLDLHARAAAVLERQDPVPVGQLAHHLRHADRMAEWVEAAEQAADQAVALGDDEEAARVLEDVLRHGPLDTERRGRFAVKLARVALEAGRGGELLNLLTGLLADGRFPRSVRGELRFRVALLVARTGGDGVELYRLFADAVKELTDRPDLQAWAMVCLGMPTTPGIPLSDNVAWLHRSLEIVPSIQDPALEVFLLGKVAMVLVAIGDAEWRRIADRIVARSGGEPHQPREVSAYCSTALEACYAGHHVVSARLLDTAGKGAASGGSGRTQLNVRSIRILLDYCAGRWEHLDHEVQDLLDELDEMPRHRTYVEVVAGCIAHAHGRLDEAKQLLVEAVDRGEALGESDLAPMAVAALVRVLTARGEHDAALARVDRFAATVHIQGIWAVTARMLPEFTRTLVSAGRASEAAALLDRFADELGRLDAPLAPAAISHARGLLNADAQRWTEAAQHLLAAADRYEPLPCPYEAARAREEAAACLAAVGDARAKDLLQTATTTYLRLGATWDLARAARRAREHGIEVRRPRRGGRTSYGNELSPRERQVAELAASGHTNKEIAQRLFLAPRTVDTHLSAIRRKLGVHSRAAITGRLDEDAVRVGGNKTT